MDILTFILELLKVALPALIVAGAMFFLTKSYLDRDYRSKLLELRMNNSKSVIPVRLQAYERACLLLERITPSNLLLRISGAGVTAQEYHRQLLTEIRDEFNHNVSQQVYMSEASWNQVKRAKEDIVTLINKSQQQLNPGSRGTDLAKRVLETIIAEENDPAANALSYIKREIQQLF